MIRAMARLPFRDQLRAAHAAVRGIRAEQPGARVHSRVDRALVQRIVDADVNGGLARITPIIACRIQLGKTHGWVSTLKVQVRDAFAAVTLNLVEVDRRKNRMRQRDPVRLVELNIILLDINDGRLDCVVKIHMDSRTVIE